MYFTRKKIEFFLLLHVQRERENFYSEIKPAPIIQMSQLPQYRNSIIGMKFEKEFWVNRTFFVAYLRSHIIHDSGDEELMEEGSQEALMFPVLFAPYPFSD